MALSEISYPVTGDIGTYQNTFPSQKPLYAEFLRKDVTIISIVSGVDNNVRLQASANFDNIQVGQFITWASDGYAVNSAKVVSIISADTIEVDVQFVSSLATNSFINYYQNYYLEIRYVQASSVTDDQDATEILDDYSQVPNNKLGEIRANISYPSDLLIPDFDYAIGAAAGLSQTFKIQFRESWAGNRSGLWVSPSLDVFIMLVHASEDIAINSFTDEALTKRFTRGYPLLYSLIYSGVNDEGSNSLKIKMTEFDLGKNQIQETVIDDVINFNGVYIIAVDTNTLDAYTTFVQFSYILSSSNKQYDPSQYDPTQYA